MQVPGFTYPWILLFGTNLPTAFFSPSFRRDLSSTSTKWGSQQPETVVCGQPSATSQLKHMSSNWSPWQQTPNKVSWYRKHLSTLNDSPPLAVPLVPALLLLAPKVSTGALGEYSTLTDQYNKHPPSYILNRKKNWIYKAFCTSAFTRPCSCVAD